MLAISGWNSEIANSGLPNSEQTTVYVKQGYCLPVQMHVASGAANRIATKYKTHTAGEAANRIATKYKNARSR